MSTQLIVALDVSTLAQARSLVRALKGSVKIFKIGSELFTAAGPSAVKMVREAGGLVFLDLKFHDIPNTVARAITSATNLGVSMLTVHTSGGEAMLTAASDAAKRTFRKQPMILGVTVLTSHSQKTLTEIGVEKMLTEQVESLARLAQHAKLGGLVASPLEVARLRSLVGNKMKLVTPGIRPASAQADDQTRVATPSVAAQAGADFIVVGRSILEAANPCAAAQDIQRELRAVK